MKHKFEDGALIEHRFNYYPDSRDRRYYRGLCESGPKCRVLVSKERLEQKWPTEKDGPEGEAFRKFAARLADAVQRAIGAGKPPRPSLRCPLGCLYDGGTNPSPGDPFLFDLGTYEQRRCFIWGYDNQGQEPDDVSDPYYRLGQAYRARFVTKAAE